MLIYAVVLIIVVAIITGYVYVRKNKLKDKTNLENHWQKFLRADSLNDINGIDFYGNKLIYNKYLRIEQLDVISKVANSKVNNYPKLNKLKEAAFNKQLYYKRQLA
ncbi:hypothetical protein [uncultured Winogradskyella sp.]|uniref:hypothetical protein n=1 Tax=uncultured Winogradskyella sp. TaxID=395353 RepID=UPI00260409F8|nr:hypothetical protein [uncultured Winogradskyella sp.]